LKHLQPKYKLLDDDFVPLVSAIEQAIQLIGDQLMNNPERKAAFRDAAPSNTWIVRHNCAMQHQVANFSIRTIFPLRADVHPV
jgi:hypothetical protein